MGIKTSSLAFLAAAALLLLTFPALALAERKIVIHHVPPAAESMPGPLVPVILKVHLQNTQDPGLNVHALVVRDGRLLKASSRKSYIDKNGLPAYEFVIEAPLSRMSYQFILETDWGERSFSPRFSMARACLPDIDLVNLDAQAPEETREKLVYLLEVSDGLQNDIAHYQRALELLNEIKDIMKR
jgi:hypothetical protein